MPKSLTIYVGNSRTTYTVEEFHRLDENTIKFKTVEKNDDRIVTTFVTTNMQYFFEDITERPFST